jgi:hypothetical protein
MTIRFHAISGAFWCGASDWIESKPVGANGCKEVGNQREDVHEDVIKLLISCSLRKAAELSGTDGKFRC